MIGGKRKGSVVPPPPPSTAKDGGGDVVGGKCAVEAENENALPPVLESPTEEEKKLHKTPAKAAAVNGDDSSGSDDDDEEEEEESDEEEEEEEEEDEESKKNDSEIEDDEADAGASEEESSEKPELAEGFFYIEAVRKHRIRRGKREYRIKWRGWPESANTWEPRENLKTVPQVLANYEESLRAKAKRKRKRRNTYSFSQPRRKKQKRSPATTAAAVKRTVPAVPLKIVEETITAVAAESDNVVSSSGFVNDTGITDLEAGEQLNSVDLLAPTGNEGTEAENNDVIMTSDKEKSPVEQSQVKPQEAQLAGENAVANGSEKTESREEALLQAGRSTGSRRRKSGPVTRFKLEQNSSGADDLDKAALNGDRTGLDGNQLPENLDSTSNDVGRKDTRDAFKNICDITEIIKPIKYTSFTTCNTLDICVTFLVKRSDGKEMTVDNKFLKAHCPALLLDFYEQRLRY